MPRGRFLKRAGASIAATALAAGAQGEPALASGGVAPPMAAHSPKDALALLKAGNARFVADKSECGPLTARRLELTQGQAPFAIILGCSDSRVPIETIFDQMPGNLFVIRVAGNFLNEDEFGTMEYGVAVLKSKLILVLGHERCGAVTAAVDFVKTGTKQPGHIQNLVKALAPAAKATQGRPGDWVANAVAENVRMNMAEVDEESEIIAAAIKSGDVAVAGGVYDLESGKVQFL
jgi:carbonic anhydrase